MGHWTSKYLNTIHETLVAINVMAIFKILCVFLKCLLKITFCYLSLVVCVCVCVCASGFLHMNMCVFIHIQTPTGVYTTNVQKDGIGYLLGV